MKYRISRSQAIISFCLLTLCLLTCIINSYGYGGLLLEIRTGFVHTNYSAGEKPGWLIFSESFLGGLFTVYTPYMYAFVPITLGSLLFHTDKKHSGAARTLFFSVFVVVIFMSLGLLLSLITGSTGILALSHHWLFNLFFFRLLAGLGLTLIGAFDISLPRRLTIFTQQNARGDSLTGIFFMALTLPIVTFSSTMPMAGLVLVLSGKGGFVGPVISMLGFSLGLVAPFVYPKLINLMPASDLNYIKVFMGFSAIMAAIKFFSNADVAQGWNILDREAFVIILILLVSLQGLHMLGLIKLTNDHMPRQNIHGQPYVSMIRLFIALISFAVAVYLLPGLWGAPLTGVEELLPPGETQRW